MIDGLKNKVAEFLLNKSLPRLISSPNTFNKFFTSADDIFIIMPLADPDFNYSLPVINFIAGMNKVTYVFLPEFKFNLLQNKSKFNVVTYNAEDISYFHLPVPGLVAKLKESSYDILIDLNRDKNVFSNAVSTLITADYKVGFQKENSDRYYNFQVINHKINPEISYRNLLNSLQMF